MNGNAPAALHLNSEHLGITLATMDITVDCLRGCISDCTAEEDVKRAALSLTLKAIGEMLVLFQENLVEEAA